MPEQQPTKPTLVRSLVRQNRSSSPTPIACLAFLALAFAAGCSDERGPEAAVEEAAALRSDVASRVTEVESRVRERKQALVQQKKDLASRSEALERERKAVAEAEKRLAEARQAEQDARRRLQAVERQIANAVSDVGLFRHVQRELLRHEQLSDVAIAANVERRVVTLAGEVPHEKLREVALGIARDTPGVADIRDEIRVVSEKTVAAGPRRAREPSEPTHGPEATGRQDASGPAR